LINWDWKLKVKTNKTYIKGSKTKHRNQKNNDWSWNTTNKDIQIIMFRGGGEKKSHQWTTAPTLVTPHGRGHDVASNNTIERYLWILEAPHLVFKVLRHLTHGACYARPTTFHFFFIFFSLLKVLISPWLTT